MLACDWLAGALTGADLDESVVLDEDGVRRHVAVDDGRVAAVQVTMATKHSSTLP